LIVEYSGDDNALETSTSKVKFIISNIINKDNIKQLKNCNLWPLEFNKEKRTDRNDEINDDMPGYDALEYDVEEDSYCDEEQDKYGNKESSHDDYDSTI